MNSNYLFNPSTSCFVVARAAVVEPAKRLVQRYHRAMSGVLLRAVDSGQEKALPAGKTTVGRGSFLAVADKRVSRSHAVLEVFDGSLTVLPIHTNPTFYKPKGEANFVDLKKDKPKELQHGDFISLLPNKYIFEVVYEKSSESEVQATVRTPKAEKRENKDGTITERTSYSSGCSSIKATKSVLDELMDCKPPSKTSARPIEAVAGPSTEPSGEPAISAVKSQVSGASSRPQLKTKIAKLTGASPLQGTRKLPPWMMASAVKSTSKQENKNQGTEMKHKGEVEKKPKKGRQSSKANSTEAGTDGGDKSAPDKMSQSRERKMQGGPDSDGEASEPKDIPGSPQTKRARTEEQNEDHGSTTRDEGVGEDNSNGEGKLPPCPYGASCYRKNPVHFQEYSHPSKEDSPESEDDRPECPYGSSCYRRNPQHKKDFKHTAASSRPKRKAAKKTAKKSVLEDESDDDGAPNTYDYDDSFLTDSESSSYGEESGDSDWTPEVKAEEDEHGDEEAEDVTELLSEARGFLRNKKMTKPV